MNTASIREAIVAGKAVMGVEFGSTRICFTTT